MCLKSFALCHFFPQLHTQIFFILRISLSTRDTFSKDGFPESHKSFVWLQFVKIKDTTQCQVVIPNSRTVDGLWPSINMEVQSP